MKNLSMLDKLAAFADGELVHIAHPTGSPFSGPGYTYSTNDYLIIRVPGDLCEASCPEAAQSVESVFAQVNTDGAAVPVSMSSIRGLIARCKNCGPKGRRLHKECPECEGEGEVEWASGGHTYEAWCKTCNGEGTIPIDERIDREDCPVCRGSGVTLRSGGLRVGIGEALKIGISTVNPLFVRKLAKYFGPLTFREPVNLCAPIYFTFEGGDGILMPMVFGEDA